jgi:uncharacterized repeat protein (TIGR03803 family)
VQDAGGALFGTTFYGGTNGTGTVFRIGTNGTGYSVLYNFTNGTDGGHPQVGVIQGGDGGLYGTASSGGSSNCGTVFRLNTDGSGFSVLYSFNGPPDGSSPIAALLQGADGALYGTTSSGGAGSYGTVFRLNTNGTGFTVLYPFVYADGGGCSEAAMIQSADGTLYGTTYYNYSAGLIQWASTVFSLSTNGSGFTIVHSFDGGVDGYGPEAAVLELSDGYLYGTSSMGGANYARGTVFKVSTNGSGFTVLHTFTLANSDANYPYSALVQGSDGALYGTTWKGGTNDQGAVFRLNTDGSAYSVIYSFIGSPNTSNPRAGLMIGADAAFYGTTYGGGTNDYYGTVFRLTPVGELFINPLQDRNVQISCPLPPANAGSIAASTDLLNWTTLTNMAGTNGPVSFEDVGATNYTSRFYRTVWNR